MINPKRDGWLMGWRIRQSSILTTRPPRVSMGLTWGHSSILAWKLLAHHDQRPYHAIKSLIYVKVIPSILGAFSLQGNSLISRIQVSSLPLYKPQTWPFLRYVNPPYLLHSWVLREFSITDLTFRGSLTGIHWCPLIGSFLLFFRHIHWHVCGWSTHWWFLCIIMPKL